MKTPSDSSKQIPRLVPSPAQSIYDVAGRIELHADRSPVVQICQLAVNIEVVNLTRAWFMSPRNIRNMNQSSLSDILLELFYQISELALLMIDVIEHPDIGAVDRRGDFKRLSHTIQIDRGILNPVDRFNHRH